MGNLESGLAGQWCAVDETTYGVVPSLSTAKFYVCDSDSLKLRKVPKQSKGIYAGALFDTAARRVITEYSAGGGLPMDLPQRYMQQWLFRMLGSYGQTASALTEDGSTGAYKAVHTDGPLEGHTFALQAGRPTVDGGTVEPATYTGCKISEWELTAALGEIVKLNLTIEARNELMGTNLDPLNGSLPALQTWSAPPGGVFYWVGASLYYGGTPSTTSGVTTLATPTLAGNLKGSMSFKYSIPYDLERYAPNVAPYRNEPLQNDTRKATGQFEVEFLSAETYYNAYAADTATAIEFQFLGPGIGTGADIATFSILCSNIRLEGESPSVDGPVVLNQTVPFTVLRDGVNNIVQATYITLDAS
jgi:hypothetical protein